MIDGLLEALRLLITFDKEIYEIIFLSLGVSLTATIIGGVIGVTLGITLGVTNFRGRKLVMKIIFTLMGIPPVVLGLFVLLLIMNDGPLGSLNLLFSRSAMVIAQTLLVIPIVTGNIIITSKATTKEVIKTAKTLGASRIEIIKLVICESKPFIFISMVLGFSRAISEVGAVMLVGGNIAGKTRVMTSYIALTNSMGEFETSIAIGLILLTISFLIYSIVGRVRGDFYD
ncbi:MAG: ABC transporter permease [Candidatus Izemoplasma sp.]